MKFLKINDDYYIPLSRVISVTFVKDKATIVNILPSEEDDITELFIRSKMLINRARKLLESLSKG